MKTQEKTQKKTVKRMIASSVYALAFAICATAQVTPSGGDSDQNILQGSTITIGWPRYIEAPNVDVYLWNATTAERHDIARNVPTVQGEFVWSVPMHVVSGTRYRFVVASATDAYQQMMSASWVTVGPQVMQKAGAKSASRQSASIRAHTSEGLGAGNGITIAPNPTNDIVRIRFASDFITMRFVSLDGSTILERALSAGERTVDVDVRRFTTGVYTVVLAADDGRCVSRPLHIMP